MAKNRGLPEERGVSGRIKSGAGAVASTAGPAQRVARVKGRKDRKVGASANNAPKSRRKKR